MSECFCVFEGMGYEVAALAVVMDAAVMRVFVHECMRA